MKSKLVLLCCSIVILLTTSCVTVKYVTKVEKVYRTPAQLTIPSLPQLSLYEDGENVFSKENYKKLLKEYSDYIVFTKQLLMLIQEHNKLIDTIKKEEEKAALETEIIKEKK